MSTGYLTSNGFRIAIVNRNETLCFFRMQSLNGLDIVLFGKKSMEHYKLKLERSWEEVKEDLKETNFELTDQDLDFQPGEEDRLLERLERKMNKSKAEIVALIESISSNQGKAS